MDVKRPGKNLAPLKLTVIIDTEGKKTSSN
jgi:hypothetical protein